jgi:hypothetical protein
MEIQIGSIQNEQQTSELCLGKFHDHIKVEAVEVVEVLRNLGKSARTVTLEEKKLTYRKRNISVYGHGGSDACGPDVASR